MINKNRIILVIVVALVVLLISTKLIYLYQKTAEDKIKIGGLFALSGNWAVAGITEANFVKLAIDEINMKGGINGKNIQLILEDDKCSATDALSSAKKLIEVDEVKIILGPSCAPATESVIPVSSDKEIILFAATTTVKDIFKNYNFAFRTSPDSGQQTQIIATKLINKNKKTAAIITETTTFAKGWAEDFSKYYSDIGGQVILTEEYLPGTTDFKISLLKILDLNPAVIFISAQSPASSKLIIKQLIEWGIDKEIQITGNPVTIDASVSEAVGNKLPEDAFVVVPYLENDKLLRKYMDTYGSQPGFNFFLTAGSYDSVYLLKEAIEKCGEDTSCINDYIKSLKNWKGEVATWNFNEFGDPTFPKSSFAELKFIRGKPTFTKVQ